MGATGQSLEHHATYEDRGTITLAAGQRYPIRMEYYENAGSATARLLWSHASITKSVVPAIRLYPSAAPPSNTIRVNFQLASAPIPAGYLPDGGLVYGARGNGQTSAGIPTTPLRPETATPATIRPPGLRHLTHCRRRHPPRSGKWGAEWHLQRRRCLRPF